MAAAVVMMTKATATMMTGETVILATKVMVAKMESELGGDDNDGKRPSVFLLLPVGDYGKERPSVLILKAR